QEQELEGQAQRKAAVDDDVEQAQRLAEPDRQSEAGRGHRGRHGELAQNVETEAAHAAGMIGRTSRCFLARYHRALWFGGLGGGLGWPDCGGRLCSGPAPVLEDTAASQIKRIYLMKIAFAKPELPDSGTVVVGVLEENQLTPTAQQ